MRGGMKFVLIAAVVFGGVILNITIKDATGNGFIGVIINVAIIAAVVAIWKYDPDKKDSNSDNDTLDKR